MLADGHVLGHVAAGLAEEPYGGTVDGVAEAGTDEAAGAGGVGIECGDGAWCSVEHVCFLDFKASTVGEG
jgi:hypothetical protein